MCALPSGGAASQKNDADSRRLQKRLRDVRGENKVCCCLAKRHLVGCCVIIFVILAVIAIVMALKWDDVKKIWDDA